jgi:hypothetical protein
LPVRSAADGAWAWLVPNRKVARPFGVCCRGQGYPGGVSAWK